MFGALRRLLGLDREEPQPLQRQAASQIGFATGGYGDPSIQPENQTPAQEAFNRPRSSLRVMPPFNPMQMTGSADGVYSQVQGSWPNIQPSFNNPQNYQANLGLQGQLGVPDTSYSGGNDAQAGFPVSLRDLLRRRF